MTATASTTKTNRFLNFENDDARQILMRWWTRLHAEKKAERSDIARAKDLYYIMWNSRTLYDLAKALRRIGYWVDQYNLAIVVGVLAKIREHTEKTFPYLAAHPKDGKK